MPNYILTRRSVILCPHGGLVTHIPTTFTEYRVNGEIVTLLSDQYPIYGCPYTDNGPCDSVLWSSASTFLIVGGVPALTNASVGMCQSFHYGVLGPAVIASFQTVVPEPTTITVVN